MSKMSAHLKEARYRDVCVLSVDECQQIIHGKLKAEDVEVLEVSTTTLGDAPAGFMGDHYRVTIKASIVNIPNAITELYLFVKTLPKNPLHYEFVISSKASKKETAFYSVLIHDLMKYYRKCHKEPPTWACEIYLTTPTKFVLEDLSVKGYTTRDPGMPMDFDHCVLFLQTLARFHASSLIFEEKESQHTGAGCRLNEVYPDQFYDWMWADDSPAMHEAGVRSLCVLLRYLPGMQENEERYEEVVKRLWACYGDMRVMTLASSEFRNVVSHGDVWPNNLLFRYEANNKPVDMKFVDYQLLRYIPPAHDFLCFLHLTTRRQLRDQHLADFARTYHEALREELASHQLDVEVILPREQFWKSLYKYREMTIFSACFVFPMINMSADLMADIMLSPEKFHKFYLEDRSSEACHCFETNAAFKELITESLEELVEHLTFRQL